MIKKIYYQYDASENNLFGDTTDNDIDVEASKKQFESQVSDALAKVYPNATIEVSHGLYNMCQVNDDREHPLIDEVENIVQQIWESWNWLVLSESFSEDIGFIEVYVSYSTIAEITGWSEERIEEEEFNIDLLLQSAMEEEFSDIADIEADSGAFDIINLYDKEGNPVNVPQEIVDRVIKATEKALGLATATL